MLSIGHVTTETEVTTEIEVSVKGAYKPKLTDPEPPVELVYDRHLMSAYEIQLPEVTEQERASFDSIPSDSLRGKVGLHRELPDLYRGELRPWLNWQTDDKGTVAYLILHSPEATFVRTLASLKLPPQTSLNYFEFDANGKPKVIYSPDTVILHVSTFLKIS